MAWQTFAKYSRLIGASQGIYWKIQAFIGISKHILAFIGIERHILAYQGIPRQIKTDIDVQWKERYLNKTCFLPILSNDISNTKSEGYCQNSKISFL